MSKHSATTYITESEHQALVALAWHDVVCPQGDLCADRPEHADAQELPKTGHLTRFLERLSTLETEEALDHQFV